MNNVKTHKFSIFIYNETTKEVEVTMTCKTKPTTLDRAREIAKKECEKMKSKACYRIDTK